MPLYRFPFKPGAEWSIGQDNWDSNGTFSHQKTYSWDMGHPEGGEIRAARAGVVIDALTGVDGVGQGGGGNALLIRHCDGTLATYAHNKLGGHKVTVGNWVAQGQPIALSGNTGSSTAPHLHFEVRHSGTSYSALGPSIAVHFEGPGGKGYRPRSGDLQWRSSPPNAILRQDGWRWCKKCNGLYFGGDPSAGSAGGVCPADKKAHSREGSSSYILNRQSAVQGSQKGWTWCAKCQGLYFAPNGGSKCPAGGAHAASGGDYFLNHNSGPGQQDWRYCNKCQGLFFGGAPGGACPAGGGGHSGSGSGNYRIEMDAGLDLTSVYQAGWRVCSKCQGLFFASNSGSRCPAGSGHTAYGSQFFLTFNQPDAPGQESWAGGSQRDWRWCSKCQSLFFGGTPTHGTKGGKCPADQGKHSTAGSGDYKLFHVPAVAVPGVARPMSPAPGLDEWHYCRKCLCLFFDAPPPVGAKAGVCPVDNQPHDGGVSGNYCVPYFMG